MRTLMIILILVLLIVLVVLLYKPIKEAFEDSEEKEVKPIQLTDEQVADLDRLAVLRYKKADIDKRYTYREISNNEYTRLNDEISKELDLLEKKYGVPND